MQSGKKLGRPPGEKPSKTELEKLYVKEKYSVREIAEILKVSKDKVFRSLKGYGITTRGHVKKSVLWEYSLESLELAIKEKGLRRFARELGINESTLRYHINKARK